jgi:hypothetical protein
VTENELLANVRATAKMFGVACYHTHRSDRSEAGFPDVVLIGGRGALFRELKVGRNKMTSAQQWFIRILRRAGLDAREWRDLDWPEPIVGEIRALGRAESAPEPTQAEVAKKLRRRRTRARADVVPATSVDDGGC